MSQSHKEPFNPFKADDAFEELDYRMNDVVEHIGRHLAARLKDGAVEEMDNIEWPEKSLFRNFYLSYNQFLNFAKVFESRGLGRISDELANEIILFSVLPLYYNQVWKEKTQEVTRDVKDRLYVYGVKKNIELGKGRNQEVRLPDFGGKKISLILLFSMLNLSEAEEKIYQLIKEQLSKEAESDKGEVFVKSLHDFYNLVGFIEDNLPSKSVFEMLIIRHLDFIIRHEKLIDELNTDTKTDARITRLIVDLFRAGNYYAEDSEQEQEIMVNNAFYRQHKKNYRNRLEKLFDYN
jgi:hypothetical protein